MPQTLVPSDNWFWACLHSNLSTLVNKSKYIDIGTKDSTSLVSALTANNTRTDSICLTAYAGNLTSNFTFDIFKNLYLTTERKAAYNRRLAQWRVTWLIEHSASHQLLWCIDSFVLRNPPLRQAPNRYRQV